MKKGIFIILIFLSPIFSFAADKFTPGVQWNDIKGKKINAHGCCVVFHEGTYYLFGEDRTKFVSTGVSCYKSKDLYNWERIGYALSHTGSETSDENDIAKGRLMERPKVIYNEKTKKWVMWFHWERNEKDYGAAKVGVAYSDKIEGPYKFDKAFQPNGHGSRDQTIFLDTDGQAYHFANIYHNDVNITLLADDFLDATPIQNTVLKTTKFEAPAIFKIEDTYFGLFSLSDGWNPTPGQSGYSTDILGKWYKGSNFAVDAGREKTYQSQSAYVLPVEGKENAFIYMGDRWDGKNGPEFADYVWLPISMRSGYPTVRWYASWDLSVFDNMYRYKRTKDIVEGNIYSLLDRESNRLVSTKSVGGLSIQDDSNMVTKLGFEETTKEYIYKIKDTESGKYLQNVFGSLRWMGLNEELAQEWYFDLQEDGYYIIKNRGEHIKSFLTVSGNLTEHNSNLTLTEKLDDARFWGVYFDSENYDYDEAQIFTKAYREENKKKIDDRDAANSIDQSVLNNVSVYPLVNDGKFIVQLNEGRNSQTNIRVIGITGNVVYSNKIDADDNLFQVDLSGRLASGLYLVHINSGNNDVVEKILVK